MRAGGNPEIEVQPQHNHRQVLYTSSRNDLETLEERARKCYSKISERTLNRTAEMVTVGLSSPLVASSAIQGEAFLVHDGKDFKIQETLRSKASPTQGSKRR